LPKTPNGLRYPGAPETEPPNGPLQIGDLAADVDTKIVGRFANEAAFLAAYPTPTYGQVVYLSTGGMYEWNGFELEPVVGCLKVASSSTQYSSGGSNPVGTTEQRVTGTITIPTSQRLFSGRLYYAEFIGRGWAGTVNEQVTLKIRVGTSTTLTTANTAVASHQFFTMPTGSNSATDSADVKFGGYFAVQATGIYGIGLFGKVSAGSFAVAEDDRGRYELILSKLGASAPGLVTVT
jgi:hypothetical protein